VDKDYVQMPNITLSIEKDLLEKSRDFARRRNTSLNSLIRSFLEDSTSSPDAAVEEMVSMLKNSSGNSGGQKIDRESLHRY